MGIGDWGLGIGHWALGIGHWALELLPHTPSDGATIPLHVTCGMEFSVAFDELPLSACA
ncbi:hypothetical protein [Nostoc sp. DSM 114159]